MLLLFININFTNCKSNISSDVYDGTCRCTVEMTNVVLDILHSRQDKREPGLLYVYILLFRMENFCYSHQDLGSWIYKST